MSIISEIRSGRRKVSKFFPPDSQIVMVEGVELTSRDIGKEFSAKQPEEGLVRASHVGKKVWIRDYGLVIENNLKEETDVENH